MVKKKGSSSGYVRSRDYDNSRELDEAIKRVHKRLPGVKISKGKTAYEEYFYTYKRKRSK